MEVSPIKIYSREAFLIKTTSLAKKVQQKLISDYTYRFYEETACTKCEYGEERLSTTAKHLEVCDTCAAFKGGAQLANHIKIKEVPYMSFPVGDKAGLIKSLRKHDVIEVAELPKFVNKHPKENEFRKAIKFTGTLTTFQPEAVEAMFTKKKGVLKAAPRSGKTVISTALICKVGRKTIILASQRDWLVGFYETFCGSNTQKPLTSAVGSGAKTAEIRAFKKLGKKAQVGFCRTYEEFMAHDVCLATVQTFQSEKGQKLLRRIKSKFSVLVVDEVHTGSAPKYAMALSQFNVEWKLGLSGTPSRKDKKFIIMSLLIGPIIYDAKVTRLRPNIRLTRTAYVNTNKNVDWVRAVTSLECDPKRLKLIAQTAIADAEAGHMVLIPLARVKAIKALTMAINRLSDSKMAAEFHGGVKKEGPRGREMLIELARRYKVKILVGQAKLLSTGVNIPRASCIYDVSMSSNKENATQRVSRILTPYDGKPPPVLRYFLDNSNIRKNCLRNEWWQCIRPTFKPIISERDEETWKKYLAKKVEERMEF